MSPVPRPFPNTRRGRLSEANLRLLEVLRTPHSQGGLARALQVDVSVAWPALKNLKQSGYVQRVARGQYQTSPAGEAVLADREMTSGEAPSRFLDDAVPAPPAGPGWTPERVAWLRAHYALLGHVGAGRQLGMKPKTVWAYAKRLGLRYGRLDGYTLLTPVADVIALMHGLRRPEVYPNLWARATRAGVVTYGGSDREQLQRRALVPVDWAEAIIEERTPPLESDMPLTELVARTGLSKTHAVRVAQPTYLRTPTGDAPRQHLPRERGEALVRQYAGRTPAHQPGRAGVLAALEAAGPEGLTEAELERQLGVSRAAVRIHLRHLAGDLERCRDGTSIDPAVWRLACHRHAPLPAQRFVDRRRWGRKSAKTPGVPEHPAKPQEDTTYAA